LPDFSDVPRRLTAEQCREKARECRDLAERATSNPEYRAALLRMADAWEEIADAARPTRAE
jgi:hypothetical protein